PTDANAPGDPDRVRVGGVDGDGEVAAEALLPHDRVEAYKPVDRHALAHNAITRIDERAKGGYTTTPIVIARHDDIDVQVGEGATGPALEGGIDRSVGMQSSPNRRPILATAQARNNHRGPVLELDGREACRRRSGRRVLRHINSGSLTVRLVTILV